MPQTASHHEERLLQAFRAARIEEMRNGQLSAGIIGKGAQIDGPFGRQSLVYADYVASGRAMWQVEDFLLEHVLPFYANSHTEASYCGGFMTRLRNAARAVIASHCGAGAEHAVVFTGSGATSGLNRLVHLMGVKTRRTLVILGPYEHHSNILPWREAASEVVQLPESAEGGCCLAALDAALARAGDFDQVVCAFSAASNVTGIIADVEGLTRRVKASGAKMIWDYAGGAPYLAIKMSPAHGAEIDAIVLSPHKFVGGPGASGLLILRRDLPVVDTPSWPGGGTVKFVSGAGHDYSASLEHREEGGTPNVLGDIRAALALLVKEAIGQDHQDRRNGILAIRAMAAWKSLPNLRLLGNLESPRLPILSFQILNQAGGTVHHQLITRMLSDRFGIQARGGCACAGPYVLTLLGYDADAAAEVRAKIIAGAEMEKPGFIRLNFSVLMEEKDIAHILASVAQIAADASDYLGHYEFNPARAIFFPKAV